MNVTTDPRLSRNADLARVERIARLLDSRYRIPGTRIRFGLDFLVGLIPGIGDTLVLAPSAWMIWRAHKHGMPTHKLARMGVNTGLDYLIGTIPIIGDIFDVGFKSNLRNAAILREHLTGEEVEPSEITEKVERRKGIG